MKRVLCIVFAAMLLMAVGCGKGKSQTSANSGNVQTADGKDYDDSVVFVDGKLTGSAFNWDYFYAKAASGRGGDVSLVITQNGKTRTVAVRFDGKSYTVTDGDVVVFFDHLVSFDASGRTFFVLTDDEGMTADKFFGNASPASCGAGDSPVGGFIVFVTE